MPDPVRRSRAGRPPPIVDVVVAGGRWSRSLPDADRLAAKAARAALAGAGLATRRRLELCVRLSDDPELRRLNHVYRGKDKPTNVLSFPAEADAPRGQPLHLGDVALSLTTLRREAREQRKPLSHHFCHLVVHGVLHLAGYDHETEAEAAEMEPLEVRILAGLSIADPYGEQPAPRRKARP